MSASADSVISFLESRASDTPISQAQLDSLLGTNGDRPRLQKEQTLSEMRL